MHSQATLQEEVDHFHAGTEALLVKGDHGAIGARWVRNSMFTIVGMDLFYGREGMLPMMVREIAETRVRHTLNVRLYHRYSL